MTATTHVIWTLILMMTILGVYAWAWSPARVAAFSEAANLALDKRNNNPEKEDNNE